MGRRRVFIEVKDDQENMNSITCQVVGDLEELMADIGILMKEQVNVRLLILATVGAYLYHMKNPAHVIFQDMVSEIFKEIGKGGSEGIVFFNQN